MIPKKLSNREEVVIKHLLSGLKPRDISKIIKVNGKPTSEKSIATYYARAKEKCNIPNGLNQYVSLSIIKQLYEI